MYMYVCMYLCMYKYTHVYLLYTVHLAQWYEDVRNVLLMRNQRIMMNTQGLDTGNIPSQQAALAMAQAAAAHAASQQVASQNMG